MLTYDETLPYVLTHKPEQVFVLCTDITPRYMWYGQFTEPWVLTNQTHCLVNQVSAFCTDA